MLAGGVALTPTYASYNKQQLAITKLAIKSVARLTKIAHWAERQFDFEVFFFVFRSVSFCFFFVLLPLLSAGSFGTQVVHTRCRRRSLSGMRTMPGDYEVIQMKCLRRPLHHRPGLLHFSSLFRLLSLSLCIFSFIFVLIAPRNAEILYAENRENLWKLLWQRAHFSLPFYSLSLIDGDSQKCFPKYSARSSCSTARARARATSRA